MGVESWHMASCRQEVPCLVQVQDLVEAGHPCVGVLLVEQAGPGGQRLLVERRAQTRSPWTSRMMAKGADLSSRSSGASAFKAQMDAKGIVRRVNGRLVGHGCVSSA